MNRCYLIWSSSLLLLLKAILLLLQYFIYIWYYTTWNQNGFMPFVDIWLLKTLGNLNGLSGRVSWLLLIGDLSLSSFSSSKSLPDFLSFSSIVHFYNWIHKSLPLPPVHQPPILPPSLYPWLPFCFLIDLHGQVYFVDFSLVLLCCFLYTTKFTFSELGSLFFLYNILSFIENDIVVGALIKSSH